jgi:hypothetical protein
MDADSRGIRSGERPGIHGDRAGCDKDHDSEIGLGGDGRGVRFDDLLYDAGQIIIGLADHHT